MDAQPQIVVHVFSPPNDLSPSTPLSDNTSHSPQITDSTPHSSHSHASASTTSFSSSSISTPLPMESNINSKAISSSPLVDVTGTSGHHMVIRSKVDIFKSRKGIFLR